MAGFQSRSHGKWALIIGANFGFLLAMSYLVHLGYHPSKLYTSLAHKHSKARAFKLMETAQKKWQRFKNRQNSANVITGVKFVNETKQTGDQ
ncbi:MAG: hypothetical protein PHO08_16510 [Methylococcales bacterium]|nr:hypothetical protein [Methylococcales bacterium]